MAYNFKEIELKWKKYWEKNPVNSFDEKKEKYYLNTSPKQINFTEKELEAKELLENIITQFPKTKNVEKIENLFQKLNSKLHNIV